MMKVLFKVLLALGAVFAVFSALMYLDSQKTDYIEIYNDDEDDYDEEYF